MTKHLTFLVLAVSLTAQAFAQDTLYFDKAWEPSSYSKAKYYRLESQEGDQKSYADYFLEGDRLQNTGQYQNEEKTGQWLWWNEKGQQTMEENWDKGKRHGAFREWYANGQLEMERFYKKGKPIGEWGSWDKEGKPKASYKAESDKVMPMVFQNLNVGPVPKNMNAIRASIGYPAMAVEAEIQGKVIVRVLVDTKGNVTSKQIVQRAHPILDGAVMQFIDELKFKPGICDEGPCKVYVNIPFEFKLLEKEDEEK